MEDPLLNKDTYERIMNKVYAVVRYQIYQ